MSSKQIICSDLTEINEIAYIPHGLTIRNILFDNESEDYEACRFNLNELHVEFRKAKITPKKIGQFVTFWKRPAVNDPIMPYDTADVFDFFVISIRDGDQFGKFVFPKAILKKKGVISYEGVVGKRALRVYPPWICPNSPQAQKTQAWQKPYFVQIKPQFDNARMQKLLEAAHLS